MYCYNCGEKILNHHTVCDNCQAKLPSPTKEFDFNPKQMVHPDQYRASPGVAALLSLFCWGLGHLVNGQWFKGGGLLILGLLNYVLASFFKDDNFMILFYYVIPLIFTVLVAFDAAMQSTELREGNPIYKYKFFSRIKSNEALNQTPLPFKS